MNIRCCNIGNKPKLLAMIIMTSSFFLLELIVGYMSNSMALVADSFHMLSDIIALIVAYIAIHMSPKTWSKNTFGYARAEVLGAFINAVFLMALCFTIFVEAIKRFVEKEEVQNPFLVMVVGIVGLLVNLLGLVLFKDSHGHSHEKNNSNGGSETQNSGGSQMNMKGVFLHILADALGSVIVIVSAIIILYANWEYNIYVDPTLSLVLVLLIMHSTWSLFKESALILLQTVPAHLQVKNIEETFLEKIPEVLEIHEFHVWNLVGARIVASLHVTIPQTYSDCIGLSKKMKEFFHTQGIHSTTIQLEYPKTEEEVEVSGGEQSLTSTVTIIPPKNGSEKNESSCTVLCPKNNNYTDLLPENNCTSATCCLIKKEI